MCKISLRLRNPLKSNTFNKQEVLLRRISMYRNHGTINYLYALRVTYK